jgi:hypothetical protein
VSAELSVISTVVGPAPVVAAAVVAAIVANLMVPVMALNLLLALLVVRGIIASAARLRDGRQRDRAGGGERGESGESSGVPGLHVGSSLDWLVSNEDAEQRVQVSIGPLSHRPWARTGGDAVPTSSRTPDKVCTTSAQTLNI